MRSKQVQILSGICGVQLIGYACRAAGFKTDIWIGFMETVSKYCVHGLSGGNNKRIFGREGDHL